MAVVTRYVRTDSAAGGDGTVDTDTGANRAYSTLSEWNTQEAANLTTGGDTHIVNCSVGTGSAADTTGNVVLSGWTTDSGDFITINGENNGLGAYDTTAYRLEYTATGGYQRCIQISENYTVVNDMQVQMSNDSNGSTRGLYHTGSFSDFNRCIAKGVMTGTPNAYTRGIQIDNADNGVMFACLAFDFITGSAIGLFANSSTTDGTMYNCTAHNCALGFQGSYADTVGRNLLAQDCTNGFSPTGHWLSGSSHNCSDIASDAPGTSTQTGDVSFVDIGNDDFQPASGDTVAKGNGVDLSGTFTFDLGNNTWPATWDIGCLVSAAAAGGASKLVVLNRHRGI